MLKKMVLTVSVFCLFFGAANGAAYAKPQIDVYRSNHGDRNERINVVAMPVIFSADVPENEHFFAETLQQTWDGIIAKVESGKRLKFRTKESIQDIKEHLFTGSADATGDDAELAAAVESLGVSEAVMTLTVTEAVHGVISHAVQSRWIPEVRLGGGYWRGDWHPRGGVILQKESAPAYDEFYSAVALKIEIRSVKDGQNTLLYGISAREIAKSGMLPNQPSLTKLADLVLRAATSELNKI